MDTLTSWLKWSSSENSTNFELEKELKFFINDEEHTVPTGSLPPEMTLNQYLRNKIQETGTKFMCLEGGCGACVVAVSFLDPVTLKTVLISVNSCLIPIYKCFGWKIYIIDQIGNDKSGYHPIQKAMVQFNGTQCGYCTPGMIMNMYALYESTAFTMQDVENAFSGNICRCTGYRPILTAFKSLASNACKDLLGEFGDIEDVPICKSNLQKCEMICKSTLSKQPVVFNEKNVKWYKAFSIKEILDIIRDCGDLEYMLVGGNTATGVYRRSRNIKVFIDVANVENLIKHSLQNDKLILGANMTLTNTIQLFNKMALDQPHFAYLKKLADHIGLIANVPVRNVGTLAGNLMIKHDHREFPSDIFLILETVGATLTLVGTDGRRDAVTVVDFLVRDMRNMVIIAIVMPSLNESFVFESYKITRRAQNAHAMVNAGFLLQLDGYNQVERARIVYGGINPNFTHAHVGEAYLVGKHLFDDSVLQGLFQELDAEISPDFVLPEPTPLFRKELSIALFYKFVLSITPDGLTSRRKKSGGFKLVRPISSGTQSYDTKSSLYPVTQPISKIEALAQSTGKAQYIMDMPDQPHQLFAAFVLAKAPANSVIAKTDASRALNLPGVVEYYDKSDIPGDNNFMPVGDGYFNNSAEELFCTGVVKYYFQPVGIIIASSQDIAEEAADLVEISYNPGQQRPLITVRDVLNNNATNKVVMEGSRKATRRGKHVKRVIKGQMDIFGQYHFHMENQCVVVIPVEDGLNIYPSTQCLNLNQVAAAKALNIPINKINVEVRRLGGGFGGKMTRNSLLSTAVALAAHKLQKPIKYSMALTTNMNVMGKRNPFSADYEVGVNDKGMIQYMESRLYCDVGYNGLNDNPSVLILPQVTNTYVSDTWNVTLFHVNTDKYSSVATRGPGRTESIAFIEAVMQTIATEMNLDAVSVRLQNLGNKDPNINKYINDLIKWANVNERKAAASKFNKENRWMKKGIAVVPMKFDLDGLGNWHAYVSIFEGDGSVAVTSSGIEMGQGINTKVVQACAYSLGIPIDQVSVKPSLAYISPNDQNTASSFTSEVICFAVLQACDILKARMKPIRDAMPKATWKQLVLACYKQNVDLSASYMCNKTQRELRNYPIYGATCVEVEIDILTGLHQILRADVIEDTGESISPIIDIGQVEGAFVMGLGYWTTEELVYDQDGQLLTNRTWTYKPPGAIDIPIDFRVKFPNNNPNPLGVLNSKATGEPPLCMAVAIPLAIRDAVASARTDANPSENRWYPFNGPSTVESTFLNSLNSFEQYTLE